MIGLRNEYNWTLFFEVVCRRWKHMLEAYSYEAVVHIRRFSLNPSENSLNLSGCDSIYVVLVGNLDIRCLRDVTAFRKTLGEFLVLAEDRTLAPNNFLSESNIKDPVRIVRSSRIH